MPFLNFRQMRFFYGFFQIIASAIFTFITIQACNEFYEIAWGTGEWVGEFSRTWGLLFFSFVVICLLFLSLTAVVIWRPTWLSKLPQRLLSLREKVKKIRWILILFFLIMPVWFLQYTPWGIVFREIYFRLLIWFVEVLLITFFLQADKKLVSWTSLFVALLLTTSIYSIAFAFIKVSSYPFSIGWSEGNRMWDYSLFFGRYLYNFPSTAKWWSSTDVGRQLIGGLPFIIPGVSIVVERVWVGMTTVLPYLMVGLAIFRSEIKNKKLWVLLALFTFIFLKQGPIHPPLVLSAFVVALLWRKPLWLAAPIIFLTGYLTEISRYTWLFAPGIWIVMLEFSGVLSEDGRLQLATWRRTFILGISGIAGGYWGETLFAWLRTTNNTGKILTSTGVGAVSLESVSSSISYHPLLWYRLWPSATSGIGIVLLLVVTVTPLISLLVYLLITRRWTLINWQKAAIILPLLAFLVVGLVVSTKAGGGGDLHNLDMFLIGVLFTAAIAWENGGKQWLSQIELSSVWVNCFLALALFIPGIQPLSDLRSFEFAEDLPWLVVLTDVSDPKLLEMFPEEDEVEGIMEVIRTRIDHAKIDGEILFMDQRQLLTFGFMEDVDLVPEYEKKVVMNAAMGDDAAYFSKMYTDLANKRFSLIISEPLLITVKDSSDEFGEESNAWSKWVVHPVLCFYEPVKTFRDVSVQLLVPRSGDLNCDSVLPAELKEIE